MALVTQNPLWQVWVDAQGFCSSQATLGPVRQPYSRSQRANVDRHRIKSFVDLTLNAGDVLVGDCICFPPTRQSLGYSTHKQRAWIAHKPTPCYHLDKEGKLEGEVAIQSSPRDLEG